MTSIERSHCGLAASASETVDVRAPAGEGEVAEHVIEGAVFEHHDDHVVDFLEVGGMDPLALIDSHGSSVVGQPGNIGSSLGLVLPHSLIGSSIP